MSEAQSRDGTVNDFSNEHTLDWDRLRDANDSYDTILFDSKREIVLKDGEFQLGLPPSK